MRLSYSTLLTVAGLVVVCGVSHAQVITNFHATLDPCQVETLPDPCPGGTPISAGTGTATLVLTETGVEADNQLSFHVVFSGLGSATTNAHIHGPAAIGVSAGVVRGFAVNGPGGAGGTHISPIDGVWRFTDAQPLTNARVTQLKSGLFYVNIHTVNYPSGEIRGQILMDVTPTATSTWGRLKTIYR
jgi:CHRD domain-containing protein